MYQEKNTKYSTCLNLFNLYNSVVISILQVGKPKHRWFSNLPPAIQLGNAEVWIWTPEGWACPLSHSTNFLSQTQFIQVTLWKQDTALVLIEIKIHFRIVVTWKEN